MAQYMGRQVAQLQNLQWVRQVGTKTPAKPQHFQVLSQELI
jgi:hypothetical protein